jgi:hypothetical protein
MAQCGVVREQCWRALSPHCAFFRFYRKFAMAALSVFVFQCEDTDLHALTLYRSGDNLPSDACSECWRYRGRLRMTLQSLAMLPLDAATAITQLRTDGISLARFSSGIILFSR